VKTEPLTDVFVHAEAVCARLWRGGLARIAAALPTELLDDARLAATEELARRGYHVIMHRPRPRKVSW